MREKRIQHQLSEHHRHGNKSCGLPVLTGFFIALPFTSSQRLVNIPFLYIEFCITNSTFDYGLIISYYLMPMFKYIICLFNYGVVLLLGVVSLMAGSTTGVPMFPSPTLYHQLDCSSFNQFAIMGNVMLNVYQFFFDLFGNILVIDINIDIFNCLANYNGVLLSDVVSLMAGSTTSVPMSFGY